MRDNEFTARLRAGAESLGAMVNPSSPDAIRRRGDRRRARGMVAYGVLAFVVGAGGGGAAYASLGPVSHDAPSATGGPASAASAAGGASAALPVIVAVTTGGAVELLDSATGMAKLVLVRQADAIGDEVAVSPSGTTVYFAVKHGCTDSIEAVPVSGGTPRQVASGVLPAISPDGTKLAFVREAVSGGQDAIAYGCQPASTQSGEQVSVVVRDLATGHEKTYGSAASMPVSHLSWSPSGLSVLISAGPEANGANGVAAWALSKLDVATGRTQVIPVTGTSGYYREGVFLPDGGLFVDHVCCAVSAASRSDASAVSSTVLQEVTGSGGLVHQVAIGYRDRDHTSLDVSQGWLLYLSGSDLFVADGGGKAHQVTSGLIAAAWLGS